jgi:hypothetical protein
MQGTQKNTIIPYWNLSSDEILNLMKSDEDDGLTNEEASQRLTFYGSNRHSAKASKISAEC